MTKLSVFITTFNNDLTLAACLESVKWADEIVVLDSFSNDRTVEIAEQFGCRVFQHKFLGYGPQKQLAMEHTSHDWVLLLDADEQLSPPLQEEIQSLLRQGPRADGYEIPRQEQQFWRMGSMRVRVNHYLRLFDKRRGHVSDMPVHAAPKVDGKLARLKHPFYHFGERSIHIKVEKINMYSTGLVEDKVRKGKRSRPWLMLIFYPPFAFLRLYLLKRNFVTGWPGFIVSVVGAFYVFLKYAKLYEHEQVQRYGNSLLPDGAPPVLDKD